MPIHQPDRSRFRCVRRAPAGNPTLLPARALAFSRRTCRRPGFHRVNVNADVDRWIHYIHVDDAVRRGVRRRALERNDANAPRLATATTAAATTATAATAATATGTTAMSTTSTLTSASYAAASSAASSTTSTTTTTTATTTTATPCAAAAAAAAAAALVEAGEDEADEPGVEELVLGLRAAVHVGGEHGDVRVRVVPAHHPHRPPRLPRQRLGVGGRRGQLRVRDLDAVLPAVDAPQHKRLHDGEPHPRPRARVLLPLSQEEPHDLLLLRGERVAEAGREGRREQKDAEKGAHGFEERTLDS